MSIYLTVLTVFWRVASKQASAASRVCLWVCRLFVGRASAASGKLHFPSSFELNTSKNGSESDQKFRLHHLQGGLPDLAGP